MTRQLAAFTIPGQKPTEKVVPTAIPRELSGNLDTSGKSLLQTGYQYLFYLALVLAVIFIIFSGIQIITSGGDSNKLQIARRRLIFAVVGLVVVVLAFFIVAAIIRSLGGDPGLFFAR